jgi:predicted DNA-binding antitoxin AbrB/MazE fold protein
MKTIHAVYERGVFRPTEPVDLPEGTEVDVLPPAVRENGAGEPDGLETVYDVLSRRFRSGCHDTAERHNEHQP